MKRKITEISIFEFFMCMFVILIHLLSEGVDVFPKWSVLSIIFYSVTKLITFAVPAFIFTSALKLFYKYGDQNNLNYPKFLWDRFRKIYIPYIIAVVIYYLVYVFILHYFKFSLRDLFGYLINGNISGQFYFIILIMQFYLLMPIWWLICKCRNTPVLCLVSIATFIITIVVRMILPDTGYAHQIFPSYLIFWIIGMFAGMYYEAFSDFLRKSKGLVYICWLIFAIIHCIFSYMQYGGLINYTCEALVVVLFCLFSAFGFLIYVQGLNETIQKKGKGVFISIANASYEIYLIHCLFITVIFQILTEMGIDGTLMRFFINAGTTYVVSILLCVIQATISQNIRFRRKLISARKSRQKFRRERYL